MSADTKWSKAGILKFLSNRERMSESETRFSDNWFAVWSVPCLYFPIFFCSVSRKSPGVCPLPMPMLKATVSWEFKFPYSKYMVRNWSYPCTKKTVDLPLTETCCGCTQIHGSPSDLSFAQLRLFNIVFLFSIPNAIAVDAEEWAKVSLVFLKWPLLLLLSKTD